MLWENLREEQFPEAIERSGGLCVISLGCVEKHGEHLPVGTDSIWGNAVVVKAAEAADVVAFPCAPWLGDVIGTHAVAEPWKTHQQGYISLNPKTLLTLLEELCDEIARNGFRKILFYSSHGGNSPVLSFFLRCQGYEKRDYVTLWTGAPGNVFDAARFYDAVKARRDEFSYLTETDMATLAHWAETGYGGIHAGFAETMLMQGVRPETVDKSRFDAVDGMSTHLGDYLSEAKINSSVGWSANYPNAFSGYPPFGSNEAIGKAALELCAEDLARKCRIIKEDEKCVRMARKLPLDE